MADVGAETLEESQERIDRGLSGLGRLLVAMARLARERGEVGLLDSLRTAEEALRTAECLSAHAYRLLTDVFSISGLEHVVEDRRRNVEAAAVADAGQALAKAEELVQLARTALGVVVVGLFDQRGHAVIEVCGLELALAFAEEGWLDAVAEQLPDRVFESQLPHQSLLHESRRRLAALQAASPEHLRHLRRRVTGRRAYVPLLNAAHRPRCVRHSGRTRRTRTHRGRARARAPADPSPARPKRSIRSGDRAEQVAAAVAARRVRCSAVFGAVV